MLKAGEYILTNVGFSRSEEPTITLQQSDYFIDVKPLNETVTLQFDVSQRFCVGWRDMTTGERFVCADKAEIDKKYEQCAVCQKRTGFNPAFYHADTVSKQQEARNLEPHIVYLAHFAPGLIKIGISHAKRGRSRLLEQGARSAMILDEFPTAHIARQYEAKIAALDGIVEVVQLRKKTHALRLPYDIEQADSELETTRQRIEAHTKAQFNAQGIMHLDEKYFPRLTPDLPQSHDLSDYHVLSGEVVGMLGSLLFSRQQDEILYLPLKKYVGFRVTLSTEETNISLPSRQTSLF